MAITLGQQSTGAILSGTTNHTDFGTNPAAGNKIILGIWTHQGASPSTVSDNASTPNTYVKDAEKVDAGTGNTVHIYRADNILLPSSGALSITVTYSTSHTIALVAREIIGAAAGAPESTNTGTGSTTAVTSNAAGSSSGDYYFAVESQPGDTSQTISVPSGWTEIYKSVNVTFASGAIDELLGNGSQTANWTLGVTPTTAWVSVIAAYTAAAGTQPQVAQGARRGATRPTPRSHFFAPPVVPPPVAIGNSIPIAVITAATTSA